MSALAQALFFAICLQYIICSTIRLQTHSPADKRYSYFPLTTNRLEFHVKSARDVDVIFTTTYFYAEPFYQFAIGAWGDKASIFCTNQKQWETKNWAQSYNGSLLSANEFRYFWVNLDPARRKITLGTGEDKKLMEHYDENFINMTIFGVTTGYGSSGEWIIDTNNFAKNPSGSDETKNDSSCKQLLDIVTSNQNNSSPNNNSSCVTMADLIDIRSSFKNNVDGVVAN